MLTGCVYSIHDLSRVQLSAGHPRFNMPFELGVAIGASWGQPHRAFVFEKQAFRLQRTLSDLNGLDPHPHHNTVGGMVQAVVNALAPHTSAARIEKLKRAARRVVRTVGKMKKKASADGVFSASGFKRVLVAAAAIAKAEKLIK